MALLHLAIDVDSDVHPELYATLAGILSLASRDERLRQLAAAGLIWETVRREGYPKVYEPAPGVAPPVQAAAPARPADAAPGRGSDRVSEPTPDPVPDPRPVATEAGPAANPRPPAEAPVAHKARAGPRSDFIDLAIDADPVSVWDGIERRDLPPASVPELNDVVDAEAARKGSRRPRGARTRATDVPTMPKSAIVDRLPGASGFSPSALAPFDAFAGAAAEEAPGLAAEPEPERPAAFAAEPAIVVPEPASLPSPPLLKVVAERPAPPADPGPTLADPLGDVPAAAPLAQRPDTKSRLMRMKERGLFR